MTLFVENVKGLAPAVLGQAKLRLMQCEGCFKDGRLFLHGVPGPEPIYVGQVRTKLEGYEALLALKALGLSPQPDYLAALRAATWLRGEMPTRLELPTAGDIRDFGRPESTPQCRLEFDFVVALAISML